jgi:mRNA-degrading endonuclease RelE of RelBE toxin-antitoxin system
MYTIEYTEEAAENLKNIRLFDRRRVLDAIDRQLSQTPTKPTRNRKILIGLEPPWEHEEPIWELRIGKYRAFYDVNETDRRVVIRAVRQKLPRQTIEDIL